ncbi:MAG: hypothetical protein EU532_11340 [Promethearchaeota archaeon]|nr:MAG: hypothetical protein EU532_11340 [Candidatus Lokiarchaeota archaeon]
MSVPEQGKAISIIFTKFPQNLLIPSIDNLIGFQAINSFNNDEKFKFDFEGENIEINIPKELDEEIHFRPGEMKNLDIKLIPTVDGYGTLTFNVNWLKRVEYTVKVKKVREQISKSQIKEILSRNSITFSMETANFNPENYIFEYSSKELKHAEKQLNLMREKYSTNTNSDVKLKDIDKSISNIAKGYIYHKNPVRALELALEISDEKEKLTLYYNLIRAYAKFDLNGTIEIVKNLAKNEKRIELIKNLALDQINVDPEQVPRIAFLIDDISQREQFMSNIIGRIMKINVDIAVKISQIIANELLRVKILINIIKEVYDKNNSKANEILRHIINTIEKSTELNLSEKNYKNPAYKIYKDCIALLAELDSTKAADNLLIGFNLREAKDKIAEEIFDLIYKMVDETRIRFDPVPVFSQYYIFNTYVSSLNENIKQFSMMGGNLSHNILVKDFNFDIIFMSLFSYDFSIFPLIDRVYTDLKYNDNKTIAYYIYPSKDNHSPSEINIMNNTLNQFGLISKFNTKPNKILILNLDFIPYLGKPTIIISSDQEVAQSFLTKIDKKLGNNVNIKYDNSLFKGGKTEEHLKQLFSSPKCELVNLILSYEFINNYEIFKTFTLSLI